MNKCLIIGRTKNPTSGLAVITRIWHDMMKKSGWDSTLISDIDYKKKTKPAYDLIILSGDLSVDDEAIKWIRKSINSPIVCISRFMNTDLDREQIIRLKNLNELYHNIYFVLWDHTFRCNFDIEKNLIVLPKPIININCDTKPFSKRSGICIGHSQKTFNPRFVSRSKYDDLNNITEIVRFINKKFKDIEIFVYGPPNKIKGKVTVVPTSDKFTTTFLPSIRCFLSLQTNETFYMVPIEAQLVGTPIMYRHAPQSITPYIHHSGLVIEKTSDIGFYLEKLYYHEDIWDKYSKLSLDNAKQLSWPKMSTTMGLILEKLIKSCK